MFQITGIPIPRSLLNLRFLYSSGGPAPAFTNPTLIADVVTRVLTFSILIAGLYFFVRLISAGYTYLTSIGEPAKIQSASKELTNAAIGLLIVISAFFLAQIIQVVFGINILL